MGMGPPLSVFANGVSFSRAVGVCVLCAEVGMSEARVFAFRERALQAHEKAMRAGIPETTQRAWLIIERDWIRMAEREELNDGAFRQVPAALRNLAVEQGLTHPRAQSASSSPHSQSG